MLKYLFIKYNLFIYLLTLVNDEKGFVAECEFTRINKMIKTNDLICLNIYLLNIINLFIY